MTYILKHDPSYPHTVGDRVISLDSPFHRGRIVRARKATSRTFWHVDVLTDDGTLIRSISKCWKHERPTQPKK